MALWGRGAVSERLWAPWRDAYVSAPKSEARGCIFCDKPQEHRDAENYILRRAERTFVILNAFPYNNGHLMVVPYEHCADLERLDPEIASEIMTAAQRCIRVLKSVLRPDAFNLGMNLGAPAGAGVADHLHLHIVPRWTGDTNFMPVVADVRVLPQALVSSYEMLRRGFDEVE